MSTHATVRLWNTDIGYLSLEDGQQFAAFEYDRDFLRSGIELAPISRTKPFQQSTNPGFANPSA